MKKMFNVLKRKKFRDHNKNLSADFKFRQTNEKAACVYHKMRAKYGSSKVLTMGIFWLVPKNKVNWAIRIIYNSLITVKFNKKSIIVKPNR